MSDSRIIIISIIIYMAMLVLIGVFAKLRRKTNTSGDFYLANRGFGAFVLILTLFATQYSGNSLLGVTGQVVRQGMGMILSVSLLGIIVVVYLTFAPQLFNISRKEQFITPGDYLDFRFKSPQLSLVINAIIIFVALSFLLAQLIAMGRIASGLTGGEIPYWAGVVFLAVIVLIYEALGGLLAVAWTDVVQGLMLLIGLTGLLFIAIPSVDTLQQATNWIITESPEKAQTPNQIFIIYWISSLFILGFGGAIYPQAIQRIYAAKSTKVLKKAFSYMIFMPLFTILILFLLGVMSIPHFSEIKGAAADEVLPQMMIKWAMSSTIAYYLMILVIVGILAALMSTADSVLLSLSSILALDIVGKVLYKNKTDEQLTSLGKKISVGLMALLVLFALIPDLTIYKIVEYKMVLSAQTAPAFVLGIRFKNLKAHRVFWGVIVGVTLTLCLSFITNLILPERLATLLLVPAGLIGLIANTVICLSGKKTNLNTSTNYKLGSQHINNQYAIKDK